VQDFTGTVHLANEPDAVLDARVTVDLNRVLIRAEDTEIGSWPHADVVVKKVKDEIYLTADGDTFVLQLENSAFFLDLLGVSEHKAPSRGKKRRSKKPVLMPEPPPPAPEGAKSNYVADDASASSFSELRSRAAASYPDETKLHNRLALGLLIAVILLLAGTALTWGPVRLMDPGSFPIGRALAGFGGLAALVGLYLATFDARRETGSAVAIAAGSIVLIVMYLYTRAAHLGFGFMLALLGSIALIVIGAIGMSEAGAAARHHDD
jgi:hypothetical protein